MPDKIPQPIPRVRLRVDVRHAAPQAGLQLGGVPPKEVHDGGPRDAGEDGPRVEADGGAVARLRHHGQAVAAGLHGQPRQRQHDAREDVDDDLLVHARDAARPLGPLPEDEVAAEEAGEEAVVGAWREEGGERS